MRLQTKPTTPDGRPASTNPARDYAHDEPPLLARHQRAASLHDLRFGDLERYEHFPRRDVWCCDVQVRQVLGQPRGGSAT